jgi:probable rRNA maturation factor
MGDVVISVEKAQSDAIENGLTLTDELDFLVIHGILHLTGYNHENASDAEIINMNNKADELFYFLKGYRIG